MGDKSPLEFTVAVRESSDQSNAKSKTFRISKVQDGLIGSDGDSGKRSVQGYIFFRTTSNSNPFTSNSQKTGVYNFNLGTITSVSTGLSLQTTAAGGFSNEPYVVEVGSSDFYWTARYSFTDSSTGATSNTVTVNITNAVAHTTFTGVVTFNGGTNQFNTSAGAVTTIDGGTIKTGRIESATFGTTGGTTGGGTRLELVTTSLNDNDSVLEIRDKTGTPTFKITKDGSISSTVLQTNTSNKTGGEVGGWEITSTTIRGVTGNDNITLDSANNRITITDNSVERVRIGKLTS